MSFNIDVNSPICLFDSGVGGLTVLKKFLEKYPNENYIYFADLANVPYGDKSKLEIKNIALNIIYWLKSFNPKLIVMACNASSAALDVDHALEHNIGCKILGMIDTASKEIAKANYKKVSVWATRLVVETGAYRLAINSLNPKIEVEEIACTKLVPTIENPDSTDAQKEEIVNDYLRQTSSDTQCVIWGCTHYPHIEYIFKKKSNVPTLDPALILVNNIDSSLVSSNLTGSKVNIYTSKDVEKLKVFSKRYLGAEYDVKEVLI